MTEKYTDFELHAMNVALLALSIAYNLKLDTNSIELLEVASKYHDIGKIKVPNSILYKQTKLEPLEYEEIKKHVLYGCILLSKSNIPLQRRCIKYVLCHHENWDGTGYLKMRGENIPLISRIIRVADMYIALLEDRPYRRAYSCDRAKGIMIENKQLFDPVVLEAFLKVIEEDIDLWGGTSIINL